MLKRDILTLDEIKLLSIAETLMPDEYDDLETMVYRLCARIAGLEKLADEQASFVAERATAICSLRAQLELSERGRKVAERALEHMGEDLASATLKPLSGKQMADDYMLVEIRE